MFTLIKNVHVYAPKYLGKCDILICGDKIVKVDSDINCSEARVIENKEDYYVIPGIIDQHVHITGGGGEGGFHTRTPEAKVDDLVKAGITTVVGVLGTDALTQSIERLLGKVKALRQRGFTAYCLTGAYKYPSPTFTGRVDRDIAFIDEIIGLKLALADHRSSHITKEEFIRLASEVCVASMLGNKCGIITLHMGDEHQGLQLVFTIVKETDIPIRHFVPTHVTRNERLFNEALRLLEIGGNIDITVDEKEHLIDYISRIDPRYYSHVTFSSDGNGSFPKYDVGGNLTEIGIQSCDGIIKGIITLIKNGYSIEEALQFGTTNVSNLLQLSNKGSIKVGNDADLVILDKDFTIDTVISRGKVMMENKMLIRGDYIGL